MCADAHKCGLLYHVYAIFVLFHTAARIADSQFKLTPPMHCSPFYFPVLSPHLPLSASLANAIYDGDKESEGEEDGLCPEDTRKVCISVLLMINHSSTNS